VGDRVYAAEAVCFFAHDRAKRPFVNFLQCKRVIEVGAQSPDLGVCRGFDALFTDMRPPGFVKH